MQAARTWIETSPYSAALGVELAELNATHGVLHMPFKDVNANPGDALHGGCAASLAAMGGQLVARAALGADAGPFYTAGIQINYLSAAIGEAVNARAQLLRKGKELCFSTVAIETEAGKSIAHATAVVRAGHGDTSPGYTVQPTVHDGSEPGRMAPLIEALPFMTARGIKIEHMADAKARIAMAYQPGDAAEDGGVHEGAVLALLDTTGAMAAWASVPLGRHKASTPAIQAQFQRPPPRGDVVAHARVVQQDRESFWSAVDCVDAGTGDVFAQGTVFYRIVLAA